MAPECPRRDPVLVRVATSRLRAGAEMQSNVDGLISPSREMGIGCHFHFAILLSIFSFAFSCFIMVLYP